MGYLDIFYKVSRVKVSVSKTEIFSKNTYEDLRHAISKKYGFEKVDNLCKYLCTPLIYGCVSKSTYTFLLDNLQSHLSG